VTRSVAQRRCGLVAIRSEFSSVGLELEDSAVDATGDHALTQHTPLERETGNRCGAKIEHPLTALRDPRR